ncbi:MAG: dTDP-4-dehydrorhamnose 3,5-epimerase [Gammaproteobacteria bacterium]|nr:dTDP-4-dehydrorhamnose 3,5-epimerase [Gammaproteobacteria bacterium]
MKVLETPIADVKLIEPRCFGDARGFFLETFSVQRYQDAGISAVFVQDNHSRSRHGVLRGLHYQLHHPQGKLVSVARGEVFDVVVDIRVGSPTFGQWYGAVLNDNNHRQMYIPPGLAHGFAVLSETVDFVYKCTDYYHPEDEKGLLWNDPVIGIDWQINQPLLSEKDRNNKTLAELKAGNELPLYLPNKGGL